MFIKVFSFIDILPFDMTLKIFFTETTNVRLNSTCDNLQYNIVM